MNEAVTANVEMKIMTFVNSNNLFLDTFFKENFVNTDVVKRYIKITNSYFIIFVNNYIGYCRITCTRLAHRKIK